MKPQQRQRNVVDHMGDEGFVERLTHDEQPVEHDGGEHLGERLCAGRRGDLAASNGAVSNAGEIHVAQGGFAALIGAKVDNSGLISAKLGSVALASGNQATLDFDDAG